MEASISIVGLFAYKNHKCDAMSLVPVTYECRTIADKLFELGVEPLSVAHFTQLVVGSDCKYIINIHIELRHSYPVGILGDLPIKWRWYKETISEDRTPLAILDELKIIENYKSWEELYYE